jgi:hypothetical protein
VYTKARIAIPFSAIESSDRGFMPILPVQPFHEPARTTLPFYGKTPETHLLSDQPRTI